MRAFAMAMAVMIGVVFSMQAPVNAEVARRLGSPFAATVLSLTGSALMVLVISLVAGAKVNWAGFYTLPWWFFIGGMVGAVVVTGNTLIVPIIGAAALVACIVLGQAIGAALIDQFGIFGLAVKPLDLWRAGGLLVMLCGLMIFHFGGR